MRRQRYPIGIQTFSGIIEKGYVDIDKTDLVYQMADRDSKYVFLPQLSVFSGLNNLEDITMDGRYATICGITELEMFRKYGVSADVWGGQCANVRFFCTYPLFTR